MTKGPRTAMFVILAVLLSVFGPANVYGQSQPERITAVSVMLFSAQHSSVVDSNGRLTFDASKNFKMAEVNGWIENSEEFFRTGWLVGDFKIHFVNFANGVMTGGVVPDLQVRGTVDLFESDWNTLFVQEVTANGKVYNTFYRRVDNRYEVLYPRSRVNK